MKRKHLLSLFTVLCAMTLLLCSCADRWFYDRETDYLSRTESNVDSGEHVSVPESNPPSVTTRRTTATISRATTTATAPPTSTTATPTTTVTTEKPTTTTTTRRDPVTTTAITETPSVVTLAKADFPKTPQYVRYGEKGYRAWQKEVNRRRQLLKDNRVDLSDFYAAVLEAFLSGDNTENKVFSPLNMYISLSMLAETTAGDSRAQILDLLGVKKLSTLRKRNNLLWNGLYRDDGAVTCRLANSVWLADGATYNRAPLDNLAENYYASVFAGEMGSEDYNTALRNWLNEQTDDLLKKQVAEEKLDSRTVLALAGTVNFSAKWVEGFDKTETVKGKFQTSHGNVSVRYMHRTERTEPLYVGDNFTAFVKKLDYYDGYSMWFVLPNEGVTPEELARDSQLQRFLSTGNGVPEYDDTHTYRVHLQVPQFDVSARMDAAEGLKRLGVTDVLNKHKADFSPLVEEKTLWLDEMNHAARVMIDEEGCEAAAYAVLQMKASGSSGKVVDFTLNRPFLFAVTGPANTMLFAGVVNEP